MKRLQCYLYFKEVQLLKSLELAGRNKLIKNIEHRNPALARELGQTLHYS